MGPLLGHSGIFAVPRDEVVITRDKLRGLRTFRVEATACGDKCIDQPIFQLGVSL
jgi:hypothetical protein